MIAPVPCDFCKAAIAPFGFAPPPHLGLQVPRPIKTCAAPGCKDKAAARVQALVAGRDPFAPARPGQAPHPAAKPAAQAALF